MSATIDTVSVVQARQLLRNTLVAERLESLLDHVAESRAAYLESIGQLAWLVKSHLIPTSDARARQLVADANTPPSAWREAATAGVEAMETALAALLAA